MPDMSGRYGLVLLVVALLLPVGCSTERDRQWSKSGGNYTTAEFTRDRDECTPKGRGLDEQCLKQRGWVPLTTDREGPSSMKPTPSRGPRY
jgi:hypothetical protein